jgi:hypothetical protein
VHLIFNKQHSCVDNVSVLLYCPTVCLFPQRRSCHIRWNTIDTIHSLLCITYWPSSQCVPHFENSANIVSVRYAFELLRDTSYIR